jgi:Glycosyltransferase like family 2
MSLVPDTALLLVCAGALLAVLALPGLAELALLTTGAILPVRRRVSALPAPGTVIAVVVPAHNEELLVERCVRSILQCDRGDVHVEVVVVADNCTDATAIRARAAGATVMERFDDQRRGKGWALDFAFTALVDRDVHAVLVVDADSVVERNLIAEAASLFAAGADAVQARYLVLNPGDSTRTRLMQVALMAFNVLRPRGRDRWGLSAGISGNGFGLSRATLQAVPYHATSVVEDLEYHVRLVRAGRRVRFLDRTTVRADMPTGDAASATQRSRWEGGRLGLLRDLAPVLAGDLLRGRLRMAEPLLDLLLAPLAYFVALLLALLVTPAPFRWVGVAGLALVCLHVIVALRVGHATREDVRALLSAPWYIVWKVALSGRILRLAGRNAAWVRTPREPAKESR